MFAKIVSFIFIISVFFTGCTKNTNIDKPTTKIEKTKIEDTQTDELDEFSDEFLSEEPQEENNNPFDGYNIFMTEFNDAFYTHFFDPVARGYNYVVPQGARKSVNNFFNNLMYPVRLINNLLQGKLKNAGEETSRFVVNTTFGILGLFDPAKEHLNLQPHKEDFGQTLGYWGVGSGCHIVLPFFGPSNIRDMIGMYPDSLVNPIEYNDNRNYNLTQNSTDSFMLSTYKKLNYGSLHLGEYEDLKKDAVDLYPYLRDIYEQHREKLIHDEN